MDTMWSMRMIKKLQIAINKNNETLGLMMVKDCLSEVDLQFCDIMAAIM